MTHYGKDHPDDLPEERLQVQTATWLRMQHPTLPAFHVPNGGQRPLTPVQNRRTGQVKMVPIIGSKLKDAGAKAGVPDWLILQPSGRWHGAAIELKTKGGSLQPSQVAFLEILSSNHYFTAVCWSLEGFMQAVGEYLG